MLEEEDKCYSALWCFLIFIIKVSTSPCNRSVGAVLQNKALKKFQPNRLTMRILLEAAELENKLRSVTFLDRHQSIISNILENSKILSLHLDQMYVELNVRKIYVSI